MSTTPAEKMREAAVKARETAEALLRALCEDEASAEGFAVAALKRAKDVADEEDGSSSASGLSLKSRAVFFEAPATAVETLVKVMDVSKKAGAPVEKRVGAIAGRTRLVGVKEVEEAIGCGTPRADVEAYEKTCETSVDEKTYGIIVSVGLPCSTNVVRYGRVVNGKLEVLERVTDPAAPSVWAMKPKSTPEAPTKETQWLYCTDRGMGRAEKMPNFKWTGDLRPAKISHDERYFRGMLAVPENVVRTDYAETSYPRSEAESRLQREMYELNERETEQLRKCCVVSRGALDAVVRAIRPGVVPDELDRICHNYITQHGGYPSPLNYYGFPKSCCISVNEVICHGIPDARPLVKGDIVNIDVTAYIYGYHGDLNETVLVGKPEDVDDKSKHLLKVALECLWRGIDAVKPGTRYRDIGDVVTSHAVKNDCSVVKTYCGHGINTLFHCAPNVPHYANNKAVGLMKQGHSFTIEPMINLGDWRDATWPDGWTAVTKDGSRSAQYEHTMVCTADGVDVLTARLPTSPAVFPFTGESDTDAAVDHLTGRLAAASL
jgi:methionyl aminopeptidase